MKVFVDPRRSPEVYVSGGWGYGNRGDNAILAATLRAFASALPNASITVTSYDAHEIRINHGLETIPSIHREISGLKGALRRIQFWLWHKSRGRVRLPKELQVHFKLMQKADLVLLAGGGYFNDSWKDMLNAQYMTIRMASVAGTPSLVAGQTIGPFRQNEARKRLPKYLSLVDHFACRDQLSCDSVLRAGVPAARVRLTADFANLLEPPTQVHGITKRMVIGLMIQNFRHHEGADGPSVKGRLSSSNYIKEIAQGLEEFSRRHIVLCRLIPSTSWDMKTISKIAKILDDAGVSVELAKPHNVDEYVAVCQNVDMMISTNMHPIILASTNNIPSLALSYNFKLDEYMKQVGLSKYTLRIDDFTSDQLVEHLDQLVEERSTIVSDLIERRKIVRNAAEENVEVIRGYITQSYAN